MKCIQILPLANSKDKVEFFLSDLTRKGEKNLLVVPLDYVSELVRCNIYRL